MTPLYDLNSPPSPFPLEDLKHHHHHHHLQLFLSLPQHTASSSSAHHPTFFSSTDAAATHKPQEPKPYDLKVNNYVSHDGGGGSSDIQQAISSSSSFLESAAVDLSLSRNRKDDGDDYESVSDRNNGSSVELKWMSSKMRLTKKMMMNSNCSGPPPLPHNKAAVNDSKYQYPIQDRDETNYFSKTNNVIRVCSDCNTTTTPLWRSGPRGPKSLCNACGIRQRKARRALEAAAANGETVAASMKIRVHHNKKEIKKSRTVGQYKKELKSKSGNTCLHHHHHKRKLCFKEITLSLSKNSGLQRVFPQDVEDAAILLMELSCGLFHT
ncbi:hypothetical protein ES288_D05G046700v1 [Gossypium darwinii]|uniref:GATA-type domain-containing protein n=1 Tax=Gossypium darwinii TaxID=34276 RepID=A0A5D2CFF3_GOSDA|nr:hypothetical protein ES288_D05G046700v1 [Gossypium darwinii]